MDEEDAKKLKTAAQDVITWLDASQAGSIEEFQDKQKELEAHAHYGAGGAPGAVQHRSAKKITGKIIVTSATDRNAKHYIVISAARQVGVKYIVFMSINRKEGSDFTMPEVTLLDLFTEATLKASGLAYTIIRYPPFLGVIQFYIGDKAFELGIYMPPSDGKFSAVTHKDLAEAHAVIFSEPGHENKTYSLTGYEPVSFADIAGILGKARNIDVPYSTISDQSYIDALTTKGFPLHLAEFVHLWVGMQRGEWDEISGDLETLLGRKRTSPTEFLSTNYPVPMP